MSKRLAILIAVEKYGDKTIKPVNYAEADVQGFAGALELGGAIDKVFLLSPDATKTSIESKVRQHVRRLTKDDELFLFYAGHGFSKNGSNFLTCYDTDKNDLEHTSIKIKDLLTECEKSNCKRIVFFLDSCESGITSLPDIRGIYSTLSDSELEEFFQKAEFRACFASCKTTEESCSISALGHGVWTYQVIQALQGNSPIAIENGRYVTAVSLQNYLTKEIPITIRKFLSKPHVQTPWLYSSQTSDFVISDLEEVLKKRYLSKPGYKQLKQIFLQELETVKISKLSGFIKGKHHVPSSSDAWAEKFVINISQKEIEDSISQTFEKIRTSMGYLRKDITVGHGKIITPDFEYTVECRQDEEQPELAIITKSLTNISPNIVMKDEFNELYVDAFSELVFDFIQGINLQEFIDEIETRKPKEIALNYPYDCSYCDVMLKGFSHVIHMTPISVAIRSSDVLAPKILLEAFFEMQKKLTGTPVVQALTV